jgi:hypothetical protein
MEMCSGRVRVWNIRRLRVLRFHLVFLVNVHDNLMAEQTVERPQSTSKVGSFAGVCLQVAAVASRRECGRAPSAMLARGGETRANRPVQLAESTRCVHTPMCRSHELHDPNGLHRRL